MKPLDIDHITRQIIDNRGFRIDTETALQIANLEGGAVLDLLSGANKIRSHYMGDAIFTCTIINAKSGRCSQDCAFCAQSAHHQTQVETYPLLSSSEMVARGLEMAEAGVTHYSMVTSGFRLSDAEIEAVCEAAAKIKSRADVALCCSIGVLTAEQADKLYRSGIRNYHHNLETARSYFDQVCTTHEYDADIASIKTAAEAGLSICSGGIMGLGETWAQRVELAMTLRDIGVSKVPLNFINPIAGTKMADRPKLTPKEALKSIALFRFVHPDKDITICGGRDVTLGDYQSWIFFAGANGVMTGNYLTTTGRDIATDTKMISDWLDLSSE